MATKAVTRYTRPPPGYAGVGPRTPDLRNRKFDRLAVTGYAGKSKYGSYLWYCDCKCGTKHKPVIGSSLVGHKTRSCGCRHAEAMADRHRDTIGKYLEMRAAGATESEVARAFGVSRQAVHTRCKRYAARLAELVAGGQKGWQSRKLSGRG